MGRGKLNRRQFIQTATVTAASVQFFPSRIWGANDRLNVACIGIGGKGSTDVTGVAEAGANIVALCDVVENRPVRKGKKDASELFPKASFYNDFRVMLEKEQKNIDAVTVSTPDHTHCVASMWAMRMGKHVYCQKPLSYSIAEARMMAEAAKKYGVQTQMGNQAHANEPIRRAVELIRAGLVGKVREVHCWTNRPIWPQGMTERPPVEAVPAGLSWDIWLGPAPKRPYSSAYAPFKWRGWWDFGTGALGDMGCHIMDMPYWALDLKYPTSVEAESEGNTSISGPTASVVTYRYPSNKYCEDLKFVWWDGNRVPPAEVTDGSGVPEEEFAKAFDLVVIGEKGKFFFKRSSKDWVANPASLLEEVKNTPITLPRTENEDVEWVEACKGGPAALSNFANSGPFTEVVLLGNLAIRVGEKIEWDGPRMRVSNTSKADSYIRRNYRREWSL